MGGSLGPQNTPRQLRRPKADHRQRATPQTQPPFLDGHLDIIGLALCLTAERLVPEGVRSFGAFNGIQDWLATKLSLYIQQRKNGRE